MAQPQFNARQKDISRLIRQKKSLQGAQMKARGSMKVGVTSRKMAGR